MPAQRRQVALTGAAALVMDWLRAFICCFIEYSATRPYLAGIATVEGAAHTDRLDYLYDNYINPLSLRFLSVVDQLQRAGQIKPFPPEVLFSLLTSGGTARFGQAGIAARMGIEPNPEIRPQYAATRKMSPRY
jgi:hypothetical protein